MKTFMCGAAYHPADKKWIKLETFDQFQTINPAAVARLWGDGEECYIELTNNVILNTKTPKAKVIETLGGAS